MWYSLQPLYVPGHMDITINKMLTHIPKSALLCKQFIVHVAERRDTETDEIHICKSYGIFWEVGRFAAAYIYYSKSTH
jgi:hypothetical protein